MSTNCLYYDNDFLFAPKGWICPKCGRVYSPSTPMCWHCGGEETTTVSTGTETHNTPQDWGHTITTATPGPIRTDNNPIPNSTTTSTPSDWIKYDGNSISLDTSKMTEEEKKNLETYFSEWR